MNGSVRRNFAACRRGCILVRQFRAVSQLRWIAPTSQDGDVLEEANLGEMNGPHIAKASEPERPESSDLVALTLFFGVVYLDLHLHSKHRFYFSEFLVADVTPSVHFPVLRQ